MSARRGAGGSTRHVTTTIVVSIAVVLVVVLGLVMRILNLERSVVELTRRIGAVPDSRAHQDARDSASPVNAGLERRITRLEARVANLAALPVMSARTTTHVNARAQHSNEEILSVVKAEAGRLREQQLEFWRSRWLETRKAQVAAFAQQNGLSTEQATGLTQVLEREIDGMVALLDRVDAEDDPDAVSEDWTRLLQQTDHDAAGLLIGMQVFRWYQARMFERQLLWPWLPSSQPYNEQHSAQP